MLPLETSSLLIIDVVVYMDYCLPWKLAWDLEPKVVLLGVNYFINLVIAYVI